MKLTNYFKSFLEKEVNLNSSRITSLDERTETITSVLKDSDKFKENFIDVIPQGSYAHKTIIKPVQSTDEFDADILLYIEEFTEWDAEDYVQELYQFFRDNSTYRDKVSRKTRCVTIDYANDFHIDVVPFMERHGSKYVTNRHDNTFELKSIVMPVGNVFTAVPLHKRNHIDMKIVGIIYSHTARFSAYFISICTVVPEKLIQFLHIIFRIPFCKFFNI